jgi:hypothetical protein
MALNVFTTPDEEEKKRIAPSGPPKGEQLIQTSEGEPSPYEGMQIQGSSDQKLAPSAPLQGSQPLSGGDVSIQPTTAGRALYSSNLSSDETQRIGIAGPETQQLAPSAPPQGGQSLPGGDALQPLIAPTGERLFSENMAETQRIAIPETQQLTEIQPPQENLNSVTPPPNEILPIDPTPKNGAGPNTNEIVDLINKTPPGAEEIGEAITNADNPIADAIDDKLNTPYEDLIDEDNPTNIQNQVGGVNYQLQTGIADINETGSAIDKALNDPNSALSGTRESIDQFGNKVESGAYGNVIDENIADSKAKESQTVIDNATAMADRGTTTAGTLESTKAIKEGLTTPETELEKQLSSYYSDAISGKLTGEDSKLVDNLNEQFDRGLAKRAADLKRAAGIRRGSGGGRFDREMGEALVDVELQKNTAISNLVANKSGEASNYALQNRLSNNDLTKIALSAGLQVGDQNLAGNEQLGNFINTQIGNTIKENTLKLDQARLDLDAQMSNLKAKLSQEEYESTYDQKERELVANFTDQFLDSVTTNLFGEANVLVQDPKVQEGSALAQGISGLADLAKFGVANDLIDNPFPIF